MNKLCHCAKENIVTIYFFKISNKYFIKIHLMEHFTFDLIHQDIYWLY